MRQWRIRRPGSTAWFLGAETLVVNQFEEVGFSSQGHATPFCPSHESDRNAPSTRKPVATLLLPQRLLLTIERSVVYSSRPPRDREAQDRE
jgi:hypothetical protein